MTETPLKRTLLVICLANVSVSKLKLRTIFLVIEYEGQNTTSKAYIPR